jgi:uncharacterized LabA/DUF88 family protein
LAQHDQRVNIAVFIDFDNIEIGVKSTLGEHFDIGTILEAIKERGEVVTKIAYADWTRAGEYSRALTQHAIRLVQRNLTPGGDKNGADINLALDALEMAFTHPHINAYVIVGGDSDFLSLVEKLKQYDKKVFVVGGRAFTSIILQRNCHEFIAYENLIRKPSVRGGRAPAAPSSSPVSQAIPIVRRALKILADREVSPQTGLLKSTLLQLDSTFSERNYGASSFLDFVEKLAHTGLVSLKHAGRSVMVELNPDFSDEGDGARGRSDGEAETRPAEGGQPQTQQAREPQQPREQGAHEQQPREQQLREQQPREQPAGDSAEGVRIAAQLLGAATNARWPMYLRNAKQILRAGNFDERKYGFGGLIDLLRACQRDGFVRLERDRRGGLRLSQGPGLGRPSAPQGEPLRDQEQELVDTAADTAAEEVEAVEVVVAPEPVDDADIIEVQPIAVVDTTAELLGRAKAKPRRTRTAAAVAPAAPAPRAARGGQRKTGTRKSAAGSRRGQKKTEDEAR